LEYGALFGLTAYDGGSSNIYKAVMMNDMEDIDVIEVWMMEICG